MTAFERIPAGDPRLDTTDDLDVAARQLAAALVTSPEAVAHRDDVAAFVAANADAAHRTNTVTSPVPPWSSTRRGSGPC